MYTSSTGTEDLGTSMFHEPIQRCLGCGRIFSRVRLGTGDIKMQFGEWAERLRAKLKRASLIKLSVFTTAAVVTYAYGSIRNAEALARPYEAGLAALTSKGEDRLSLGKLEWVVFGLMAAFALRLYLHAWVIDEAPKYRAAIAGLRFRFRFAEWFFRSAWVVAMAFLPEFYGLWARTSGEAPNPSVFLYTAGIASVLVVWDLLMGRVILRKAEQNKRALWIWWFLLDGIMAVLLIVGFVFSSLTPRQTGNWNVVAVPMCVLLAGLISLVQTVRWAKPVFAQLSDKPTGLT